MSSRDSYRDNLAALAARHAALEREVASKRRELADAAQLLDDARARARLPVLDDLQVASPCPARWEQMAGDDRVRHCGDCRRRVYNLSSLMRDEAEALIQKNEGHLCVRYFERADGTILFRDDCEAGALRRQRRHRRLVLAGAAAAFAGGAAVGTAWRLAQPDEPAPSPTELEIQLRMRETIGKYDGVRPAPRSTAESSGQSPPGAPSAPPEWE
jgi:hypothetical protein